VGSRQLYKSQKRVHSTRGPSDKVYQLLAHGRWFSPGTAASSTAITDRHDIAEILLKVVLSTINKINQMKNWEYRNTGHQYVCRTGL
jgi:hypothetical protein